MTQTSFFRDILSEFWNSIVKMEKPQLRLLLHLLLWDMRRNNPWAACPSNMWILLPRLTSILLLSALCFRANMAHFCLTITCYRWKNDQLFVLHQLTIRWGSEQRAMGIAATSTLQYRKLGGAMCTICMASRTFSRSQVVWEWREPRQHRVFFSFLFSASSRYITQLHEGGSQSSSPLRAAVHYGAPRADWLRGLCIRLAGRFLGNWPAEDVRCIRTSQLGERSQQNRVFYWYSQTSSLSASSFRIPTRIQKPPHHHRHHNSNYYYNNVHANVKWTRKTKQKRVRK